MRIVVLDGHALNPGDLSWEPLERLGGCTIHDRTPAEQTVERARGAEVLLTNKTELSAESIAALPELRYVGVLATGYNVVDVAAAAERGIVVTNVPAYATRSVAQLVFAHLLTLCHRVQRHSDGAHAGRWSRSPDFCYWDSPLVELAGRTMGIVGLGRIGSATADLAAAFGMDVLAHDPRPAGPAPDHVTRTDLPALLAAGDVVSLHCPLTDATRGLIGREQLAAMKPTAWLVNTSRGPLIDEDALADALRAGRPAFACLDVLSQEPPPTDHPLLGLDNCLITPHVAWATKQARRRLLTTAVENVAAFLAGRPVNVVTD
jgi:glycerate dehydrogenase